MTYESEMQNDRQKLCRSLRHIAWGYILLYLDVNFGTFNILPNWLGFLLILFALSPLAAEVPSAALLRSFAALLAAWCGVTWLASLFGLSMPDGLDVVSLVVSVITLYFHFQLLTDLATLSEKYGCPQTDKLMHLRTVNTLLTTAMALPLPWKRIEWLAFTAVLIHGAIVIWICLILFGMKHSLSQEYNILQEENKFSQ